jgi:hypothetical protein
MVELAGDQFATKGMSNGHASGMGHATVEIQDGKTAVMDDGRKPPLAIVLKVRHICA